VLAYIKLNPPNKKYHITYMKISSRINKNYKFKILLCTLNKETLVGMDKDYRLYMGIKITMTNKLQG